MRVGNKTSRELLTDAVQRAVDDVVHNTVLPAICDWLLEHKQVTVTAQELASTLDLQQKTKPASPYASSYAPVNGGFTSIAQSAPAAPKTRVLKTAAKPTASELLDPNFNDGFDPNKCLYSPARGGQKFRFCDKQKMAGSPVCVDCSGKQRGLALIEKFRANPNLDPYEIQREITAKRISEASKEAHGASATVPKANTNTYPVTVQRPPSSVVTAVPAPEEPKLQARKYMQDANGNQLYIINGPDRFVVKNTESGSGELIVVGISVGMESPLRTQLTRAEETKITKELKFDIDSSCQIVDTIDITPVTSSLPKPSLVSPLVTSIAPTQAAPTQAKPSVLSLGSRFPQPIIRPPTTVMPASIINIPKINSAVSPVSMPLTVQPPPPPSDEADLEASNLPDVL